MNKRLMLHVLLYILLGAAAGFAIYFLWIRPNGDDLSSFASVRESFTDNTHHEAASVYFIRVDSYDSVKIRAVADLYEKEELAKPEMPSTKRRTLLMHFFVEGDTATLRPEMLDELAYTHPEVTDPSGTLMLVPGGFVRKIVYEANAPVAAVSDLKRTSFYMARPGINAKDLRNPTPDGTVPPDMQKKAP